jgi:hypothetical protein
VNVAVTVVSELSVTWHVPVPEQPPPDQPVNVEPADGFAVSVTAVPVANCALQVEPQLIPDGELVTVPAPVPALLTVRVEGGTAEKFAVTEVLELSVTWHVPVPEQPPPDHPVKVEPPVGVAVSVTGVPAANWALHVEPQLMPAGELDTVPVPAPVFVTLSVGAGANGSVKFAVTVVSELRVTTQLPVPEQPPPDQPVKVEPLLANALRVTVVPAANWALQVDPQKIPPGELKTSPLPVPVLLTVSVGGPVGAVNVAVTVASALSVTWQVPVPEQPPPDQPAKVEPPVGLAVSVTCAPWLNCEEQVVPQLMPAGELVTVPVPVPDLFTVSVCCGTAVKVAVTEASALNVTWQVPVPEQPPPDQPAKVEPAEGFAVRVT